MTVTHNEQGDCSFQRPLHTRHARSQTPLRKYYSHHENNLRQLRDFPGRTNRSRELLDSKHHRVTVKRRWRRLSLLQQQEILHMEPYFRKRA